MERWNTVVLLWTQVEVGLGELVTIREGSRGHVLPVDLARFLRSIIRLLNQGI